LTGRLANAMLSNWQVSGILTARSGRPVNVIAGQDRSLSGIQNQRVNQVLENPYGDKKTPEHWLNPAAFAQPALGTLGSFRRNSLRAPGYWSIDLAISRLIAFGATRKAGVAVTEWEVLAPKPVPLVTAGAHRPEPCGK